MNSIEEQWEKFTLTFQNTGSKRDIERVKIAFYGGIVSMLTIQNNLPASEGYDYDEALNGWIAEIRAFRDNLSKPDTKATLNPTRKQSCPVCGNKINSTSCEDSNDSPHPGDFALCLSCQTPLVFGEAMDLRAITPEEAVLIREDLDTAIHNLKARKYTILASAQGDSLLCHKCGMASSNQNDIKNKYCGNCKEFLI